MKSVNQLSYLPSLFRSPFLRKVATGEYYDELVERLEFCGCEKFMAGSLRSLFDDIYSELVEHYRCEYVYKNILAKHWLRYMGVRTNWQMSDEFRIGRSRVDLAVFTDTSIAFEIKTDLDSTARLTSQTADYIKLFDRVYIVTSPRMSARVLRVAPKSVGLVELSSEGIMKIVRESESHLANTSKQAALDCLRQKEMISIAASVGDPIGDIPTSRIYRECLEKFMRMPAEEVHRLTVEQIASRNHGRDCGLIRIVPDSLVHAAVNLRASKREVIAIKKALDNEPTLHLDRRSPSRYEQILPVLERQAARVFCVEALVSSNCR